MNLLQAAQDYLESKDCRIEQLKKLNANIEDSMSDECVCGIFIPAHNEAHNMELLIDCIENQVFPTQDIGPQNFEVYIVENNSEDDTEAVALEYVKKKKCQIPIRVLSATFEKNEKVVGSARRLGADFALYRLINRNNKTSNEFYIASLDADNPIPKMHFYKIVKAFREKNMDTLCGYATFNPGVFKKGTEMRAIADTIHTYYEGLLIRKPLAGKLAGSNHAFKAQMYMQIGGYPRWQTVHDTFMGVETERLGGVVGGFDSYIVQNARRMLLNPIEFLTGHAWEKSKMDSEEVNTLIRNGNKLYGEYNTEEIKMGITSFIDDRAAELSMSEKLDLLESIDSERCDFLKVADENQLEPSILPNEDMFCVPWMTSLELRSKSKRLEKEALLEKDQEKLKEILRGLRYVYAGNYGCFRTSGAKDVADIVSIAVCKSDKDWIAWFQKNEEYVLYKEKFFNKRRFLKRIDWNNLKELTIWDHILALKKGRNHIPDYQTDFFEIRFYDRIDGCFSVGNDKVELVFKGLEEPVEEFSKPFLLITNNRMREKEFENLYQGMNQGEKERYRTYVCYMARYLAEKLKVEKENNSAKTEVLHKVFGFLTDNFKSEKQFAEYKEMKDFLYAVWNEKKSVQVADAISRFLSHGKIITTEEVHENC